MANAPKRRFKNFTNPWQQHRLSKVAPLQRGFDLPKSDMVDGDFPVVMSSGILHYHNEYKVKAPGVVTGRSGTIGKLHYVEDDYWPHNTTLWVTDFKDNVPKFIYHLYSHTDLSRFGTGTGVPTLNRNDVHSETVYMPCVKEQEKIALFLDTLDNNITAQTQKLQKQKALKSAYLTEMFPAPGETKPKRRFNGFTDPWQQRKLSEVSEISSGITGDTNLLNGDYKLTRIETIANGEVNQERIGFTNTTPSDKAKLNVGDILYSNINSLEHIGKVAIFEIEDAVIYHGINLLRFVPIKSHHYFLYTFLLTDFAKNWAKSRANKAVSQASINQSILATLEIAMPCIDEQTQIGNFFKIMDDLIAAETRKLEKLQTLKKAYLSEMFV